MKLAAAAITFGLLLPAIAFAQKTSFDFDKTADFTTFRTYTLRDGTPAGDPLIDKRIVDAIGAELARKGLTRHDDSPDLVVVYHAALERKQDIQAFSTGVGYGTYGYGWSVGWGTTDVRVIEILVGTLVIDVADAAKKEIVFRGIGAKEVDVLAKPEKRDKSIAEAVKKILKNYPPKPKTQQPR